MSFQPYASTLAAALLSFGGQALGDLRKFRQAGWGSLANVPRRPGRGARPLPREFATEAPSATVPPAASP